MFLDLDKKPLDKVAAIDDKGATIHYGEICDFAKEFANVLSNRSLVIILSNNSIGSLIGYTSCLINHIVPLVISCRIDNALYDNLLNTFNPEYIWQPSEKSDFPNTLLAKHGFVLVKTDKTAPTLHSELSLLLPTSGSTGSSKLVRHSYKNIEANAKNVCQLFQLTSEERAMAVLPMHYTMGLSVITSHLYAGATILLSSKSLLDPIFWKMLKERKATSFTGVPYSYEILEKVRFFRMELPDLKIITQGGGKMTPQLFEACADYAEKYGKQFIATYGQTECTARMAYLPAELAKTKTCSIGIAEPGGQLSIIDENGVESFEGEASGELVYRGENVTMGYAECAEDLAKGDENHGIMYTGDFAYRDKDGCYFITGRKKRFLKIFGLRIGLDEVEQLLKQEFGVDSFCTGTDENLTIKTTDSRFVAQIPDFIEKKIGLFHKKIHVEIINGVKRNESGKIIYE